MSILFLSSSNLKTSLYLNKLPNYKNLRRIYSFFSMSRVHLMKMRLPTLNFKDFVVHIVDLGSVMIILLYFFMIKECLFERFLTLCWMNCMRKLFVQLGILFLLL